MSDVHCLNMTPLIEWILLPHAVRTTLSSTWVFAHTRCACASCSSLGCWMLATSFNASSNKESSVLLSGLDMICQCDLRGFVGNNFLFSNKNHD